jgi:leucyl/phenylalanyl-tRNA--protein transferase
VSLRLPWLAADPASPFPPPASALRDPDGLLAAGGDLHPVRLLNAYRQGIFPWYGEGEPILWWSPDPRTVFRTERIPLSRRDRRALRGSGWIARADTAFDAVLDACARMPRRDQAGVWTTSTWITAEMQAAYRLLHRLGHAHSVEVFASDGALVGGIYGVAVGRMFFGESMVSLRSGGSKAALAALAGHLHARGWPLIDAQVSSAHLLRLGAEVWPRSHFLEQVATLTAAPEPPGAWTASFGDWPLSSLPRATDADGG